MPSGQTLITYNEVELTNCVTEQFAQEAVFDPSGTDLLYHKFTVTVTGYCIGDNRSSNYTIDSFRKFAPGGQLPTSGDSPNPTVGEVWIRSHLEKPRHDFEMRMGVDRYPDGTPNSNTGSVLLSAKPYPAASPAEWILMSPSTAGTGPGDKTGYDLNNGPRCLQFDIISVRANELFEVRATFEVCKLECESGNGRAEVNKSGVLSNRWSVMDRIDSNRMTDRTISGRLRVTTPLLSPQQFRDWVVPMLQAGFRRDSVEFTVTEDGLWLQYSIVDKEIAYAAPYPATSWQMEHTERTDNAMATVATLNVTLSGDRDVDRRALLAIAMSLVKAKLYTGFQGKVEEYMVVSDHYGDVDNSVGVFCSVSRPRQGNEADVANINSTKAGVPIVPADLLGTTAAAYNRDVSGGVNVGDGTYIEGPLPLLGAFHAYLQTPCDELHEFANSPLPSYGPEAAYRVAYTLSGTVVGSLPDHPVTGIAYTHQQNPYTNWQMESIYEENTMRVQMPIAGSAIYSPASGSNSVVVSLGGGITKRIIRCKGTRIGKPPEMPKAVDEYTVAGTSGKARLLDTKWRPHTPTNTVDNQRVFTIEAEFTYAIPSRLWDTTGGVINPISIGYNPWETSSPTEQMTVAATTGTIA